MAIDAYMTFTPYTGPALDAELNVDFSKNSEELADGLTAGKVFEISSYSGLSIEHILNIGSQSTGVGSGRVEFKEFSIERSIDKASPIFFDMACSGTAFKLVTLALRKAAGGDSSGQVFLRFDFKLVGVKTVEWAHDDTSPKETVTFEYGGLFMRYCQQKSDGSMMPAKKAGWNRVKNVRDETITAINQT